MRLCVRVIPVCSVDVPAVSGVVSVLKYCVKEQILATSYRKIILILPDDGRVATETCRIHSE